jgi:hypothetical protein
MSVIKFQPYDKYSFFITDFVKLFFDIETIEPDDVSCFEYSESDRDILIGLLAPHILRKNNPDGDDESDNSMNIGTSQGCASKKDGAEGACLSLKDLENQTFLELIDFDCFKPANKEASMEVDESNMNTNTSDNELMEEKIESEHFIPYFTKDYNIAFGSPNYIVFIK